MIVYSKRAYFGQNERGGEEKVRGEEEKEIVRNREEVIREYYVTLARESKDDDLDKHFRN